MSGTPHMHHAPAPSAAGAARARAARTAPPPPARRSRCRRAAPPAPRVSASVSWRKSASVMTVVARTACSDAPMREERRDAPVGVAEPRRRRRAGGVAAAPSSGRRHQITRALSDRQRRRRSRSARPGRDVRAPRRAPVRASRRSPSRRSPAPLRRCDRPWPVRSAMYACDAGPVPEPSSANTQRDAISSG